MQFLYDIFFVFIMALLSYSVLLAVAGFFEHFRIHTKNEGIIYAITLVIMIILVYFIYPYRWQN